MVRDDIKKQVTIAVVLAFTVSVILVLTGSVINLSIKGTQEREAQKYMKEIVSQYKNIITAQLDGDMQTLDAVAVLAGQDGSDQLNDVLPYLEDYMKEMNGRNDFLRMGVVAPDGLGYFVDADGTKHYGIDVGGEEFVRRTLSGERVVSDIEEDRLSAESVIFCGVPVTHDGNVIGAVTATRTTDNLSEIISREIFDGIAFIHIVDRKGDFVLRSDHAVIQKEMDNIFDEGDVTEETKASILADIKNGGDSFAIFRYQGKGYWVTFIPVGINDWQIFCLVPQTFLNHNLDTIFLVYLCVMICMIILFMILFLYIYSLLRKKQETLQILAYKDVLTGTGNRNGFVSELPVLLEKQVDYALVLMNVSGFKFVNEFFGFERGNALLQHIAGVLEHNIGEGERCYRDNADRFGMLLLYSGREELIDRLKQIHRDINSYIASPNQEYRINCNFGIHIIQGEDKKGSLLSPDGAINGALLALNSVNGNMTNPFAFYDETIHEKARKKVEIASQMHAALANREFHMYLQPKYNLTDKSLHSAEALVRWYTADGVIHYPDEFIPVFEENGFITELDMFMLEEACRQVADWRRQGYDIRPISVNQSRIFFYDEKYFDKFYEIVNRYHIDPSLIILEVTESVAMSNLERVKKVIKKLHSMGFSISMDDFGSGYSSLNTLKDLDIAELKLDREFLSEQSTSRRGRIVIESVVHLARALSITTVAEGIENLAQLEFMESIHCDIGQGYYFAKPMPVEEFERTVLHMREG
ncbi:MAG: EAL domain-containing protein [Hungatella hathewayi]|nr:EAL domain-containing protein [Hungatella hathewayi]